MFSWAPWVTQVRTLEALRRLDWQGDYLTWAHLEAEGELLRLKDAKLNVIGANSLYQDNLPIHQEIREAVKKAGAKYPAEQMSEGWIAGMVIEAAMRGVKGDPTPAKVQESMSNLKVDLKGLRGGPIEWTKDNHFRTQQFYRVYRWDAAKNAIAIAKDWYSYDVK
jgi:branched-chain amino acid transport system substrate-binding protein